MAPKVDRPKVRLNKYPINCEVFGCREKAGYSNGGSEAAPFLWTHMCPDCQIALIKSAAQHPELLQAMKDAIKEMAEAERVAAAEQKKIEAAEKAAAKLSEQSAKVVAEAKIKQEKLEEQAAKEIKVAEAKAAEELEAARKAAEEEEAKEDAAKAAEAEKDGKEVQKIATSPTQEKDVAAVKAFVQKQKGKK